MPPTPPAASPLAPPPNFGRFAAIYAPVEWLSFGRALSRRRECFLAHPRIEGARRVLVLGDGDGRFTAALLQRNPAAEVTAVDVSAAMLAQLERRVRARTPNAHLELHCADARSWPINRENYDLVVTHFFLDCFTTADLVSLVQRITPALAESAVWLVSDFAIPNHPLWTPFAKLLLRFLYFTFGLCAGLRPTHLPDHHTALKSARFELSNVETGLGGSLRSEIWHRLPALGPAAT